jgi:hypothetical protein
MDPIRECWINETFESSGLAQVAVVRDRPRNRVTVGLFLVDLGCLGLKSCTVYEDVRLSLYRKRLFSKFAGRERIVPCDPDLAATVILGGIAYARGLGFEPDPDFEHARHVLDGLDPAASPREVEFGRYGKPFYMSGPYDDVPGILAALERRLGAGGFEFIAPIGPTFDLAGSDDAGDEEMSDAMRPLSDLRPDLARGETRFAILPEGSIAPAGEFAFLELFCGSASCDCRRVLFQVWSVKERRVVATVSYGFDRKAEHAGPFLDPLCAQGPDAGRFLDLMQSLLLCDRRYIARLEEHYRAFKEALADRRPRPQLEEVAPPRDVYAPCPCGSGQKYRFCCRSSRRSA